MGRVCVHEVRSPIGCIFAAATETYLIHIGLPGTEEHLFIARTQQLAGGGEVGRGGKINAAFERQIHEYLSGSRHTFGLPIALQAAPFHRQVLKEVARIPYGATKTYGELAHRIGAPRAARAVGAANARNPLPLIIPCHRVLARNGLGGYGGGLELKKKLLILEGALLT